MSLVTGGFEVLMRHWLWRTLRPKGGCLWRELTIAVVSGTLIGAAFGGVPHLISQKGREFRPSEISIKAGEALEFINDDGDLLHHTYLKSDRLSFDSGDQKPGSKFEVIFPVVGQFTVRCAIHPKMKLVVSVD
jgi:plastocyanin